VHLSLTKRLHVASRPCIPQVEPREDFVGHPSDEVKALARRELLGHHNQRVVLHFQDGEATNAGQRFGQGVQAIVVEAQALEAFHLRDCRQELLHAAAGQIDVCKVRQQSPATLG
jgi:hypothetical protein